MLYRLVTTLLAALLAIGIMAYCLSGLGVTWHTERSGQRRAVELAGGVLAVHTDARNLDSVLARDRYYVSANDSRGEMRGFGRPWFRSVRSGGALQLTVSLLPMVVIAAAVLAVLLTIPRWRLRRRIRRKLCGWCGYPRGDAAVCSECGRDPDAAAPGSRSRFSRLVRDAAALSCAVVVAVCCAGWATVVIDQRSEAAHRAKVFDYSWYLEAAGPRLSGAVMYAEPGKGPNGLPNTLKRAGPGTTIVLLPGVHDLGANSGALRGVKLRDLWLLGCGRDKTTLTLQIEECSRLRIEGATIDCQDDPFLDLRQDGSVQIRDCLIRGYNSGAGGSNAIFASDSVLLVENCEFEGKSGRASPSLHGEAFDLRGQNMFFIRGSKFIDNQYVFRDGYGVLDSCQATATSDRSLGEPYGGKYLERNCEWARRFGGFPRARPPRTFAQALDDLDLLKAAPSTGGPPASVWTDPVAHDAAAALRLDRGLAFWHRLLLHPNPEVRQLAAAHVGPPKPSPGTGQPLTLEEGFAVLTSRPLSIRAALVILGGGDEGRTRLEKLKQIRAGTPDAVKAEVMLRLMDVQPPLPEQVEAAERLRQDHK